MSEYISRVIIQTITGADDKECGVFSIELYQGANRFFRVEYGSNQDWNQGHTLSDSLAVKQPLNDQHVRCIVALEERNGQVNITWDAEVDIRAETDKGRSISFHKTLFFSTDDHKPSHRIDLGSQSFP